MYEEFDHNILIMNNTLILGLSGRSLGKGLLLVEPECSLDNESE